jgi:hypothetical protein
VLSDAFGTALRGAQQARSGALPTSQIRRADTAPSRDYGNLRIMPKDVKANGGQPRERRVIELSGEIEALGALVVGATTILEASESAACDPNALRLLHLAIQSLERLRSAVVTDFDG